MSLAALAARLRGGELSPREAVQEHLDRIERLDPLLNAYIAVRGEEALAEAERAPRGPLWGVPVAVKDVLDVAGMRTTAASRVTEDDPPAVRDAAAVARLRDAGAVLLGKLNTHEFAYGARSDSAAFGPVRNPWDTDRIAGGSSGGSGAAVAADLAAGTLGTDTAGSIRIPAAFNGVTGIRPSTGRVPTAGVTWVSWTFDTIGPLARSAEDCALLLEALTGEPIDVEGGVGGLRVGLVSALFAEGVDPRVAELAEAAVGELHRLGARVEPVAIPRFEQTGTIQQLVMLPEATAAHARRLRTRLADYGADVRGRLLAGALLPPTAVVTGLRARRAWIDELSRVFARFDVLAAPAMPVVPPRHGEHEVELGGVRVPYRVALIRFNSPWSLAGVPAASLPCGFVDGLPVGLCLVGRHGEEATVLRAAHAYQRATDWHERRPALATTSARG